ncbi:putative UDP-glycosyltransferase 74F2-like [Capsicum annuum]|nr:putative UDP-glycosyltransferase 74F2-like [Capsicum annuum]
MLSLSKPSTGELGERPCKAASLSVTSMSASQLLSGRGVHITSKAEEFLAYTFPSKASSREKGVKKSSDQLEHAPSKKTGVESVLKHHSDIKKSESKFQDQDSTSTLSTGQSNHMEAAMGKSESATNTLPWPQVHHDHPTACLSYPWDDTYFGRLIATYGSKAIIYPQIVGVTSTRVALPLECTESLPIYVNAKQYSAILKRRQVARYLVTWFSTQRVVVGRLLTNLVLMRQASSMAMTCSSSQSLESLASLFTWVLPCRKLKTSCMLEPDSTLVLSIVVVPTQAALQMHSYWCTQMDNQQFILGYVTLPFPD